MTVSKTQDTTLRTAQISDLNYVSYTLLPTTLKSTEMNKLEQSLCLQFYIIIKQANLSKTLDQLKITKR